LRLRAGGPAVGDDRSLYHLHQARVHLFAALEASRELHEVALIDDELLNAWKARERETNE
jgi:hypothetical protein